MIVETIVYDRRSILTVCQPLPECEGAGDVTVALPHLVGRQGVIETFAPSHDDWEHQALPKSAQVVRDAINILELQGEG